MSFVADSADYTPETTDYVDGNEEATASVAPERDGDVDLADVPVTEEIAVPMSRNNVGNRFVAVVFDRALSPKHKQNEEDDGSVVWETHHDRIALSEAHVMWARKQNLYNETFNTESMADVLWSRQM